MHLGFTPPEFLTTPNFMIDVKVLSSFNSFLSSDYRRNPVWSCPVGRGSPNQRSGPRVFDVHGEDGCGDWPHRRSLQVVRTDREMRGNAPGEFFVVLFLFLTHQMRPLEPWTIDATLRDVFGCPPTIVKFQPQLLKT
jgi:hypothetical protein